MLAGYEWMWATDVGRCVDADPEVAPELKGILLTAVDANPDRRFPSIVEMRVALTAYSSAFGPAGCSGGAADLVPISFYSCRSAVSGSMRAARRAGR